MMHSRLVLAAAATACTLAVSQAPPQAPPAFAPATARGGLVFVSGILPAAPMPAGFDAQAAQVLDELRRRLQAAGTSLDRVASTSVYLASASDFAALNTVWAKYWPSTPPAR
ncbi:MAG: RidA family protein, partial [Vicinamibacterales bacterium]